MSAFDLNTQFNPLKINNIGRKTNTPLIKDNNKNNHCNKLNILIGKSLTNNFNYLSKCNQISSTTIDPLDENSFTKTKHIWKNKLSLISSGNRNFKKQFIKSLPYAKIRSIQAHGSYAYQPTLDSKAHTMDFIREDINLSSKVLSLFRNKQDVIFVNSCFGGAIHNDLKDELGDSTLVTFIQQKFSSHSWIDIETSDYIAKLTDSNIDPKHIILKVVSRFPEKVTVKLPGKSSFAFGGNMEDCKNNKKLLEIAKYLGVEEYLKSVNLNANFQRRRELKLFTPILNFHSLSLTEKKSVLNTILKMDAFTLSHTKLLDGSTLLHAVLHKLAGTSFWKKEKKIDIHNFTEKVLNHWIKSGASINDISEGGYTPLHLALRNDDPHFALKLIDAGADIDISNEEGDSIIHYALEHNEKPVVLARKLISKGAKVNKKNNVGNTPLHTALSSKGTIELVDEIVDAGADINAKNHFGVTPLFIAARDGYIDLVKKLIDLGAVVDVYGKVISGLTILDVTEDSNIAKLLLEASKR